MKEQAPDQRPSLLQVGTAAAALAAHIREHHQIKGHPTPPSGGPRGGRHDATATLLSRNIYALRLALIALDQQMQPTPPADPDAPGPIEILAGQAAAMEQAIDQADALPRIRAGLQQVMACYGFDRMEAGEVVPEVYPEIDEAAVRFLEWGASKLLPKPQAPPEATSNASGPKEEKKFDPGFCDKCGRKAHVTKVVHGSYRLVKCGPRKKRNETCGKTWRVNWTG